MMATDSDATGDDPQLHNLFSLPNGDPALFHLYNFQNEQLTNNVIGNGGLITDDGDTADVILTTSRDEYKSLKDRYAVSRKTYVRLSGFVDRCIYSRRFQLAPIIEKGVPGRKPGSRRTEFTEDDDEHLCQYIAEVLPDNNEGGRAGHFIYLDLMRRANEFGQYTWARRHTKDAWRERYRKNRSRLDKKIAEIVKENPPAPDEKGRYKFRRYVRIGRDDELNADDDELERGDSSTDNEDGPVETRRTDAQRQEEEEEDYDGEQAAAQQPEARFHRHNQDARNEEEAEEQAAAPEPKARPRTRAATQRSRASRIETPTSKRRRTGAPQVVEKPVPGGVDATLLGANVDDQLAEKPNASSFSGAEADSPVVPEQLDNPAVALGPTESDVSTRKRVMSKARPLVVSLSPRLTRSSSRLHAVDPLKADPAASRANPRANEATLAATPAATPLKPITESQVIDEFKAYSDDESDIHEVEAELQVSPKSRGGPRTNSRANSLSADDLQTSRSLQGASPNAPAAADSDDDQDDDDSDAELDVLARPPPKTSQDKGDELDHDHDSSEEIFPSPGTHASAEKRRRTQAAKAAPYLPPRGTRAASMIEKERVRAAQVRRR
ncbi:hypothetical protein BJV78DRAFT_1329928 [Lactifluus subvellereus]|nr:hypothetical protein BJV78DRAFT_1329928 [Lactifluus subvellereus]